MSDAVFKSIKDFFERYDKYLLFILSLVFNCVYIIQTPYLFDWDEKFHALVAKNLSADWRIPILITDTIVQPCKDSWVCCGVWLHKQPLFLYQMALSIKIFGVNEFAVRFPSALMVSLLIFPVYRIAEIISDKRAAVIAALLIVTNSTILSHVSGYSGMDHNDIAYLFYVTLSIWALVEYINTEDLKFIWLLGLFSGLAILNKWVTGLIALEGLIVFLLFFSRKAVKSRFFIIIRAFVICVLVFLPWQIYTLIAYTDLALHEFNFNTKHFFEVIENHNGNGWFYIFNLPNQYSNLHYLLIAIPFCLWYLKDKIRYTLPLFIMLLTFFIFFSIAKTKLAGYTIPVMPISFVFIGLFIQNILYILSRKIGSRYMPIIMGCVLFLLGIVNLNIPRLIQESNTTNTEDWRARRFASKKSNAVVYKQILKENTNLKMAIVGFSNFDDIDCRFYTGFPCYGYYLNAENIQKLKSGGYQIAVFRNLIPENLQNDKSVIILPYDYSH
jgi:4-amino-4-deoxy-L-arabinose transferase